MQATAGSPETGNVCVQDYQPGAVCTAQNVQVADFIVTSIVEACESGTVGEMELQVQVVAQAEMPDRYDLGLYLDLSGLIEGAKTGDNCFHDYFDPPLTATPSCGDANNDMIPDILNGPWWDGDGDTCGDIESSAQEIKDLTQTIRVPCVDNDNDGFIDVHACFSWDNNTMGDCFTVVDAFPSTASKCGCQTLSTDVMLPIPVELTAFEVE